jgi:hypothetical protein
MRNTARGLGRTKLDRYFCPESNEASSGGGVLMLSCRAPTVITVARCSALMNPCVLASGEQELPTLAL